MTNQSFRLENRITQRRVEYECPKGFSLTYDNGVFTIIGKQGKDTYGFRFIEEEKCHVLAEIMRKIHDEQDGLYWAGYTMRDLILENCDFNKKNI